MKTHLPSISLILLLFPAPLAAQSRGTPVLNPANGHHYEIVTATVPWDQAKVDAEGLSFMGVQGHLATISDTAEDQFVYFTLNGGALGRAWLGGWQDPNHPSFSEPAGGWVWVTGEDFTYTNWSSGQPSNAGGNERYLGYWPADQWNDDPLVKSDITQYVVEYDTLAATGFCAGDGTAGACPCGNDGVNGAGCANSSGIGALLTGTGSASIAIDHLELTATGLPPGQTALLFQGSDALGGSAGLLFGDGLRCAGHQVIRLHTEVADASGGVSFPTGLAAAGGWNAGDTRRFQVWYGDPVGSPCAAGFNTTNGVEVCCLP